jgi:hypothetical protein
MAGRGMQNEKLKAIARRRAAAPWIAAAVFCALTLGVFAAVRLIPGFVEKVYRPISRAAFNVWAHVTSILPFSLCEILIYIGSALILFAVVRLIVGLIRGPSRRSRLLLFLGRALLIASVLLFIFYGFWGFNYDAPPLANELGYSVKARDPDELGALCAYLANKTAALDSKLERDQNGAIAHRSFGDLAKAVAAEFEKISGKSEASPKYILAAEPMNYTLISGIFSPFTAEANVNPSNVLSELPFCMAHELAHRYAIAPEDEANFFAFYMLKDSNDPLLSYSAHLYALLYCQNKLYAADYDAFAAVYATYSAGMRHDLAEYSAHWNKYKGTVSAAVSKVNDAHLKFQGLPDGERSYGRMVDLMLVWYDAEEVK